MDDTEITEFSAKNGKIRFIREIRVPKFLNSDFEKTMGVSTNRLSSWLKLK